MSHLRVLLHFAFYNPLRVIDVCSVPLSGAKEIWDFLVLFPFSLCVALWSWTHRSTALFSHGSQSQGTLQKCHFTLTPYA